MKTRRMRGPKSLFRNKVRAPVSLTLTQEHHRKANAAVKRLGLTRADVIGLLIAQHADDLTHNDVLQRLEKPPRKKTSG